MFEPFFCHWYSSKPLSDFVASTEKVTDWPKTIDWETGWVSIVGVTAGEFVVIAALGLSSEFRSSALATAVTLT